MIKITIIFYITIYFYYYIITYSNMYYLKINCFNISLKLLLLRIDYKPMTLCNFFIISKLEKCMKIISIRDSIKYFSILAISVL